MANHIERCSNCRFYTPLEETPIAGKCCYPYPPNWVLSNEEKFRQEKLHRKWEMVHLEHDCCKDFTPHDDAFEDVFDTLEGVMARRRERMHAAFGPMMDRMTESLKQQFGKAFFT